MARLPLELRTFVADELEASYAFSALASLARTSKEWVDPCRDALYRFLSYDESDDDPDDLWRFTATVMMHPHLAARVLHVSLDIEQERYDYESLGGQQLLTEPTMDADDTLQSLKKFEKWLVVALLLNHVCNLRRLKLGVPTITWQRQLSDNISLDALNQLQKVHLMSCRQFPEEDMSYKVDPELAGRLLNCPHLVEASIFDMNLFSRDYQKVEVHASMLTPTFPRTTLTYLGLDFRHVPIDDDTVVSLIYACSNLLHLRLSYEKRYTCARTAPFAKKLGSAVSQSKKTLENLELQLPQRIDMGQPPDPFISLRDFAKLKWLFIDVFALSQAAAELRQPFPDLLPESIEQVHFAGYNYQDPNISPTIRDIDDLVTNLDLLLTAKKSGRLQKWRVFTDNCQPPLFQVAEQEQRWNGMCDAIGLDRHIPDEIQRLVEWGTSDPAIAGSLALLYDKNMADDASDDPFPWNVDPRHLEPSDYTPSSNNSDDEDHSDSEPDDPYYHNENWRPRNIDPEATHYHDDNWRPRNREHIDDEASDSDSDSRSEDVDREAANDRTTPA
ncbi:MAG: hypothetical protein Q9162_004726 [Coniocarpon cinnabarinum]